mmetsp:Transcript_5414/g.17491  ORF Transcript_5414/g.17491 Transcript_5414/m.17491 type:complete len:604 (-) Transcript_5414:311-2122(-)
MGSISATVATTGRPSKRPRNSSPDEQRDATVELLLVRGQCVHQTGATTLRTDAKLILVRDSRIVCVNDDDDDGWHSLGLGDAAVAALSAAPPGVTREWPAGELTTARVTLVRLADGHVVTAGFVDPHVHLVHAGHSLSSLHLGAAVSRPAFDEAVREAVASFSGGPTDLLLGYAMDVTIGAVADRTWLDGHAPSTPMVIFQTDAHSCLLNSAALSLFGISKDTPAPAGGAIGHDADGHCNGVLRDAAMQLVTTHPTFLAHHERKIAAAVDAAVDHCASVGVTTVHNMACLSSESSEFRETAGVLAAAQDGAFDGRLRVRLYTPASSVASVLRLRDEYPFLKDNPYMRIGGVKGFLDGSLGSRTAAFFEPLAGVSNALYVTEPATMESFVQEAADANVQCAIHAIGDAAVAALVTIVERVSKGSVEAARALRLRVEHAQHARPADVVRMGELGMVASVQPQHLVDDGRYITEVLDEARCREAYVFGSMLRAGVPLAIGSDWPVARADPLVAMRAAIVRRTSAHPSGWNVPECLTWQQALLAATAGGAYAGREEDTLGFIGPNAWADLVILTGHPAALGDADDAVAQTVQVQGTIVGGCLVKKPY